MAMGRHETKQGFKKLGLIWGSLKPARACPPYFFKFPVLCLGWLAGRLATSPVNIIQKKVKAGGRPPPGFNYSWRFLDLFGRPLGKFAEPANFEENRARMGSGSEAEA